MTGYPNFSRRGFLDEDHVDDIDYQNDVGNFDGPDFLDELDEDDPFEEEVDRGFADPDDEEDEDLPEDEVKRGSTEPDDEAQADSELSVSAEPTPPAGGAVVLPPHLPFDEPVAFADAGMDTSTPEASYNSVVRFLAERDRSELRGAWERGTALNFLKNNGRERNWLKRLKGEIGMKQRNANNLMSLGCVPKKKVACLANSGLGRERIYDIARQDEPVRSKVLAYVEEQVDKDQPIDEETLMAILPEKRKRAPKGSTADDAAGTSGPHALASFLRRCCFDSIPDILAILKEDKSIFSRELARHLTM